MDVLEELQVSHYFTSMDCLGPWMEGIEWERTGVVPPVVACKSAIKWRMDHLPP